MTRRGLLLTLLVAVIVAGAGAAAYAAFSSTTANPNDSFAAGTVYLTDNDAGARMFSFTNKKPTDTATACINVTYSGSLSSNVRLYATVAGSLAPYVTVTVTRGTDSSPSFSSCTNFTADSTNYIGAGNGVIFNGALSGYPTSYATGLVDPTSGSPATWSTNNSHSYKFSIGLTDDLNARSLAASADFIWEARNL